MINKFNAEERRHPGLHRFSSRSDRGLSAAAPSRRCLRGFRRHRRHHLARRSRHLLGYIGRASRGCARQADLDSSAPRRRLALAPRSQRQPLVSDRAPFPTRKTRRLGGCGRAGQGGAPARLSGRAAARQVQAGLSCPLTRPCEIDILGGRRGYHGGPMWRDGPPR